MLPISVIICTYNRAPSLADTLESLSRQTYSQSLWELIVVDNNSSDNTRDTVLQFSQKLPNLRYEFEPQQGLSYARNLGIKSALGDIIAFTDDDVLPAPDWLEQIQQLMAQYPCDACGGYIAPQWEAPPPAWLTEIFYGFIALKTDTQGPRPLSLADELPFGANMVFRQSMFARYGVFDTQKGRKGNVLAGGEDIEMFERILKDQRVVYYFPSLKVTHKVEAFRLKKNYFRRWRYQCSKNIAHHSEFAGARKLFGVPLYLIKQTLDTIIKTIRYGFTQPSDIAFRQEMIIWHFFGLIVGLYQNHSGHKP